MTVDEVRDALEHIEALDVESRVDLEAALYRLKPVHRQLLVLRAMGYTSREAMALAGCTSEHAIYRAERALVKEMNRGA